MAQEFQFVTRHNVRRTDDYWFEIDEYRSGEDQFLLAHVQFFQWKPAVFKRALRDWRLFRQHVTAPIFACPPIADKKWFKFVTLTGFRFQENILCEDGETRPLFIHTT